MLLRSPNIIGGSAPAASVIFALSAADSLPKSKAILRSCSMGKEAEEEEEEKVYAHYNHTDSCKHLRWTARESYEFMEKRPWHEINDFYSNLVIGHYSLSYLFGPSKELQIKNAVNRCGDLPESADSLKEFKKFTEDRRGRWQRLTFKIVLSYHGGSFDGWQKQPGLNTVQGMTTTLLVTFRSKGETDVLHYLLKDYIRRPTDVLQQVLENSLGGFVDEKKAQQLKERLLPVEPSVSVAGRTDKGVSALQQICSFYTWKKDIDTKDIEDDVNNVAPGKIRALVVSKVSRDFHPNFSAKWRRYLYIFPLKDEDGPVTVNEQSISCDTVLSDKDLEENRCIEDSLDEEPKKEVADFNQVNSNGASNTMNDESQMKPKCFSVSKVNQLMRQLEGKSLSYKMFSRDTKASRSTGPATECYLFHARAVETILPCETKVDAGRQRVMCVELVANRFLRKMVRVLVSTAIREAAAGADDKALLRLMDATCRRATAPPAPPDGLCLVEVGYEEFIQDFCLII